MKHPWKDRLLRMAPPDKIAAGEENFRIMFDKAADATLVFDGEAFVDCNEAALKILRAPHKDKIIGLRPFDISPEVQPDGRLSSEKAQELINTALKEGFNSFEWVHRTLDGNDFWVEVTLKLIPVKGKDVLYSVLRDISKRKAAEAQLRESEERYRVAIENSNDGVAIVLGDRHAYVNKRFLDIFGYDKPEEVIGKTAALTVHPDDLAMVKDYNRRRQSGGSAPPRYEFKGIRKDGTTVFIETSSASIVYGGSPASIAYMRDITDRKRAERQQELITKTLERLNNPPKITDLTRDILLLIKKYTGIEALGIRIRSGDDFPYVETDGFSPEFVESERVLCVRDQDKGVVHDLLGKPYLQCMCGNVIGGKVDVSLPFFTEGGSFWTNCMSGLSAASPDMINERMKRTCLIEGYESVALIPLRSGEEVVGLLQLNDKLPDRFDPGMIQFLEGIGASIGIALSRKEAAEKLLASERKYRGIFENAVTGIYQMSPNGRLISVNPALARMFGYSSPAEMKQQVTAAQKRVYVNREDKMRYHDLLAGRDVINGFETELYRKDQSTIWVSVDSRQVKDAEGKLLYHEGIVQDISDRKRLERHVQETTEELRQSEARLRIACNAAGLGIWDLDPDTGKVWVSHRHRVIYGPAVPLSEWTYDTFINYIVPEDREEVRRSWREDLEKDACPPIECRIRRDDGQIRWIRIEGKMEHLGGSRRIMGIVKDITEDKQLEEQRRQGQKMQAVGTLAGGIAHDFNNILAIIVGNAELALDDLSDLKGVRRNLERVVTASNRARELIKQILTFSRKTESQRKPVSLSSLLRETYDMLRAYLPTTIHMTLDIKARESGIVADSTQVQQVLVNLATNAAYAMRENGGRLAITLSGITFRPDRPRPDLDMLPGRYAQVKVKDTGTGMAPEVQKRIFEPFFTTKETGQGTGMGLAVAYGIIKSHGGGITVESRPKEGSTFKVYLPLHDSEENTEAARSTGTSGGKERILFVDDEAPLAEMTGMMLERLGYRVTVATDPSEALNMFLEDSSRFDCVITDQTMPDITGVRLAEMMIEARKDIPIIISTGYSDAVSPAAAKSAGIRAFIMKPTTRKELAETIRRVLDRRETPG
ncbi:MAG: Blue-light-activated protein [Syntrophorhabdaceae bacterium PtaU1.Bin034]|nr:MAG: Blue-light-activated protein [Syntrophorhabdaceae bacterium PtaU1.Bin034]